MNYNIARCREAQGDLRGAEQAYDRVLAEHPDYTDCIIRLGYIKYMSGHKADAESMFKRCLDIPGGREDGLAALCLIKQRDQVWASAKVRLCVAELDMLQSLKSCQDTIGFSGCCALGCVCEAGVWYATQFRAPRKPW